MKALLIVFALSSSYCFADEDAVGGTAAMSVDCETGNHCFKDVNFTPRDSDPMHAKDEADKIDQGPGKGVVDPTKAVPESQRQRGA